MKKSLINVIQKILRHELITGSIVVFLGGLASNVFSFLYNLFIARNLSYSDYATVASLMSIIALATLPSQSFSTIIIQFTTGYFSKHQEKHAAAFYVQITKLIVILSLVIVIGALLFSPSLSSFLKIENRWYAFLAGVVVGLTYLGIVNSSFLQSLLKFKLLAFFAAFGSFLRLFFGLIFIFIGWRVYGALGALVLAYIVAYLMNIFPLKFIFFIPRKEVKIPIKELLVYALPASLAVISLSSFTSTDIILVKHFFNAKDAGLYAGVSLIGRVIFYFTAPIPSVMFPMIIKKYNNKEDIQSLFYLALGLVFFASILITSFYFLFPKFTITLFLGGRAYLQATPFLGLFGIYLTIFSLVNVFTTFFLSIKKTNVGYGITLGAIAQIIAICLFHKDFFQIITISTILSLVVFIGLLLYYVKDYGEKRKKISQNGISYHPSV